MVNDSYFLFSDDDDVSIINLFKQAFNMTYIRCFGIITWDLIYLWSFISSRRPFKISKIWKCDIKTFTSGTAFGGYHNIRDRLGWEFKSFMFHRIEMKLLYRITLCVIGPWNKIIPFVTKNQKSELLMWLYHGDRDPLSILRSMKITRPISLSRLSITSGSSSCIDDSGNPPSKARYEATNVRLRHCL